MSEQGKLQPGQQLRAEREARGMTQEEAARRLNLTVTYLEALEADDYERLPEAAFVKGYIRNYARELELPGDELAEAYSSIMEEQAEEVPETVEVMPSPKRRRWVLVAVVVTVVVIVSAVVIWQQGTSEAPEAQASAETDTGAAQVAEDAQTDEAGGADSSPDSPVGETQPSSSGSSSEGEPEADEAGPTNETGADASVAEAAPDRLVMTFSGECWVRVTGAEGRDLFEGRRGAGVPLTLTGAAPFSIRVGDASAVSGITVNDEDVSMPSGAPGQVVRLSVP